MFYRNKLTKTLYVYGKNVIFEILNRKNDEIVILEEIFFLDCESGLKLKSHFSNLFFNKFKFSFLTKKKFLNLFRMISGENISHQNIAARIKYHYFSFYDLKKDIFINKDIYVFADRIQDPQNLGSIIRTSVAFNVKGIFLPFKKSAEINATVFKTSSGAATHLKIFRIDEKFKLIKFLKTHNFLIISTITRPLNNMQVLSNSLNLDVSNLLFLLGNEKEGITLSLLKMSDYFLNFSLEKNFESLNVAVTYGIIMSYLYIKKDNFFKIFIKK